MHDTTEFYKSTRLQTKEGWLELLEDYGHIWFAMDGVRWFIFPEGPHKYGLCAWEGPDAPNFPQWEFESEGELLNAKLFNGRSILERLGEVLCYDSWGAEH